MFTQSTFIHRVHTIHRYTPSSHSPYLYTVSTQSTFVHRVHTFYIHTPCSQNPHSYTPHPNTPHSYIRHCRTQHSGSFFTAVHSSCALLKTAIYCMLLMVVGGIAAATVSTGELYTMATLTQGAVGTGVERIANAGKAATGNGVARAAIETREQLAHVLWNTSLHVRH